MTDKEIIAVCEQKLNRLLELLKVEPEVEIEVREAEGSRYLHIGVEAGDEGYELIGRHGRLLDALNTVMNMMVSREGSEITGIWLDVNNYRVERTKYVEELARKASQQAIMNHEPVELLPMKPWERRIVHMLISETEDVVSDSIGEGYDRRVVVKPA